jgi:hypothetical protein
MKKFYYIFLGLILILSSVVNGQYGNRQAGLSTGVRSGIFYKVLGADGWLAAEYRFRDIPLNISLNLKPYAELTIPSFVKIMPGDIGISISYVF